MLRGDNLLPKVTTATLVCLLLIRQAGGLGVSWDWGKWWTYDGISGPQFWGLINPEWSLCTHGRRQSPVNLEPPLLLYDPNLRPLHIDKNRVSGTVNNTGHSVVFTIHQDPPVRQSSHAMKIGVSAMRKTEDDNKISSFQHRNDVRFNIKNPIINITGGPLSYRYRLSQIQLHFGSQDHIGSEHTVNTTSFPAELQIYGYNSQLFSNFSDAIAKAHGIVAISIMIQVGNQVNSELRLLTDAINNIRYAGSWDMVQQLSVKGLLPSTEHYITYEGSLTQPPCHETVTWLIINKPIYITKKELNILRKLHQGPAKTPKARMVNNFRPTQQLHHRPLRTNIDFTNVKQLHCPSMARQMYYTANSWR